MELSCSSDYLADAKVIKFSFLRDGTAVRAWKNPLGVDHIFLAAPDGKMIYGGFVGWIHSEGLNQALSQMRSNLT